MQENKKISTSDKAFLKKSAAFILSPTFISDIHTIIPDSLKFVKECQKQGHNIFILSNWDRESFPLAKEKNHELFDLFKDKHIITSGEIGLMKPDPRIYQYILDYIHKTYDQGPDSCIFFDDQQINIDAAEKAGIYGVVCKNPTYTNMQEALDTFLEIREEHPECVIP